MPTTSDSERRTLNSVQRLAILTLLSSALLGAPRMAGAQSDADKAAARDLAEQAARALESGDANKAQDLYRRAFALVPAPTLSLRRARALEQLGRWVEAAESYVQTTRLRVDAGAPPAFQQAIQQAEESLSRLRPRIPKVTVVLKENGPFKLTLDDKPFSSALVGVATPVDPGEHRLAVITEDGRRDAVTFSIQEADNKSVELELDTPRTRAEAPPSAAAPQATPMREAPPVEEPSSQRTWAFVGLGIGAAGLATGAIAGLMATKKHSSAEDACPAGRCIDGTSGQDDVDAFRRLRTVSTVGYVVGVVGVGAGVALFLTAPTQEKTALSAWASLNQAGIRGSFR